MIRVAAFLAFGLLAATPAAAGCRTAPEHVTAFKSLYPGAAFVGEIPASLVPTVLAWLESEGLPHRADRIVQVVGDRGLGLVLIAPDTDWDCDGTTGVELIGAKAAELVALVRRYQDLKGIGQERGA